MPRSTRSSVPYFVASLWLAAFSGQALAEGEIIDSAFSTCTGLDCNTTSVAAWLGRVGQRPLPWAIKIFGRKGNCLRMNVVFVRNTADLEMTVIAPNGFTFYRDDNSGSCVNCPAVKIDAVPLTGFYTVAVSTATGVSTDVDFHLQYGQYNTGNPNCSQPTATQ